MDDRKPCSCSAPAPRPPTTRSRSSMTTTDGASWPASRNSGVRNRCTAHELAISTVALPGDLGRDDPRELALAGARRTDAEHARRGRQAGRRQLLAHRERTVDGAVDRLPHVVGQEQVGTRHLAGLPAGQVDALVVRLDGELAEPERRRRARGLDDPGAERRAQPDQPVDGGEHLELGLPLSLVHARHDLVVGDDAGGRPAPSPTPERPRRRPWSRRCSTPERPSPYRPRAGGPRRSR